MTLHTLDPIPAETLKDGAVPCYTCDTDAVGTIDGIPVCEYHTPAPCEKCGRFVLHGMYPFCGRSGPSGHGHVFNQDAQRMDPIVVHYDPSTQTYRFPAATDARVPNGFERRELRNFSEVRRFQKHWNTLERKRVERAVTSDLMRIDAINAQNRSELRAAMRHMSPQMRDFAQFCMDRNDATRPRMFDPGVMIEAMEYDRSNRDPHCDARTGWRDRR